MLYGSLSFRNFVEHLFQFAAVHILDEIESQADGF